MHAALARHPPPNPEARRRVWIDARGTAGAPPVFGMTPIERNLRALAGAGIHAAEIVVEHEPGLSPRIPRELAAALPLRFVPRPADAPSDFPVQRAVRASDTWFVLAGDSLVDPRLLEALERCDRASVAWGEAIGSERPFAARLDPGPPTSAPDPAPRTLSAVLADWQKRGVLHALPLDAAASYRPKLRRTLAPYCLRIADPASRDAAERFLFWSNYKGSTDFFTKHVYPPLVWRAVRGLARRRIHPNWISAFNIIITVAAIPLFAGAHWIAGLTCAYTMSVLDSVDGKLARLTFTDSKLGHVLDHGLDVIHPPFWYAAWAWALDGGQFGPFSRAAIALAAVYVLDRIVTEIFTRTTGRSIHAFAPIDVRMRTWISRRNINVPLFTLGLLLGVPGAAFAVVVAWQGLTFLFHTVRLVQVAGWGQRAT